MSTDRANKIIDEFMDGIAAANALRPSLMPRAPRRTLHPASRAASPRVSLISANFAANSWLISANHATISA